MPRTDVSASDDNLGAFTHVRYPLAFRKEVVGTLTVHMLSVYIAVLESSIPLQVCTTDGRLDCAELLTSLVVNLSSLQILLSARS